jgi:hemerythrin
MSVGVAVLDDDHKKLIAILNTLSDGLHEGKDADALGKALNSLIDYTDEHFKREETFLVKTKYPSVVRHMEQHKVLRQQVLAIQEKYQSSASPILSAEVMTFLKNWLLNHILLTDKDYSPHAHAKDSK